MKVKELFTDGSRWQQGAYAKTRKGLPCTVNSPEAYSFCLYGAICFCYPSISDQRNIAIQIQDIVHNSVEDWNDSYSRSVDDVREMVSKLDI